MSLGSVMSIRARLCVGNHYFYRMCLRAECAVCISQLVRRDFWFRIPSVYIHLLSHWHHNYSIISSRSQLKIPSLSLKILKKLSKNTAGFQAKSRKKLNCWKGDKLSLDTTSLFPELESLGVEATGLFLMHTEQKSWMHTNLKSS